MTRAAAVLGLLLLAPAPARGHGRSLSYSAWEVGPAGARVQARITRLDLSRLAPDPFDGAAGGELARSLRLTADGRPCEPVAPPLARPSGEGWATYEWEVACPAASALVLATDRLLTVAPSHLHFARVTLTDGRVEERVLAEADARWTLTAAPPGGQPAAVSTSLAGWVGLGVRHILSGWDHLAFLLALLLLAASLGELAALVTAFTLAHSLTLALAVLGAVRPQSAAVEALIGCSILLVAAENVWLAAGRERWIPRAVPAGLAGAALLAAPGTAAVSAPSLLGLALFARCHFALLAQAAHPTRLRAAAAFAFGLLHGLGFAGTLATLELPRARLVPALLGFNVGVELGQLAFVALLWPLLRLLARTRWAALTTEAGSAAVAALGTFWFVSRAWG